MKTTESLISALEVRNTDRSAFAHMCSERRSSVLKVRCDSRVYAAHRPGQENWARLLAQLRALPCRALECQQITWVFVIAEKRLVRAQRLRGSHGTSEAVLATCGRVLVRVLLLRPRRCPMLQL